MDGISLALTYKNGKLVRGATRGDGTMGEDITRNVMLMKGVVKQLPVAFDGSLCPEDVDVRAEIVVCHDDFDQFFQGDSNPRNSAAGTAKRQSNNLKCKYLTVVSYQIILDGEAPSTKLHELTILQGLGFTVVGHCCVNGAVSVDRVYKRYVDFDRDALNYDIDGLIIELNGRDDREAMGTQDGRPKGSIAYKFPHETKPTVLRNIHWQTGRSGRITPVADFDAIRFVGATAVKASLHNISYIDTLAGNAGQQHLAVGDRILVSRRNEVIPYVEEVLEPTEDENAKVFKTPTACPVCGSPVVMKGEYLLCTGKDQCPAQVSGAIKRWIAKLGVKHFGTSLIDLLCESGRVETIADIYRLDEKDVALMDMGGRRVGGTANKAFRNLRGKTDLPLHVFVGSLGIELIGRSMAKTIVDAGFDSLKAMSHVTPTQIAAIPGVGSTKADAFCDGFWDLLDRGTITDLLGVGITIQKQVDGPLKGKTFCMTGFRDPDMATTIEAQGGTLKSGVSKGLTTLVTKDATSTSGKAEKARKYGTEVIDIDTMWNRLGGRP